MPKSTASSTKPKQRPIVQLIELMAKKWVMRIIWELREGPKNFRALQEACDKLSPTSLNNRVQELIELKLIEKTENSGYTLTSMGCSLLEHFYPLNEWAKGWVKSLESK